MQPDLLEALRDKAASDQLLTLAEVCDLMQISVSTLYRLRRSGTGPAWIKVRGAIRFRHSAVQAYLDQTEDTRL